jgi:hypothetical protein
MKVPTTLQIQRAADATKSKALDKINGYLKSCGLKDIDQARKNRVFKVKPKAAVKRATVKKKAAPAKKKVDENNQQKKHGGKRPNSGGARKGSGRKVGAATVKTRKIADKLVEEGGMTPLEYMLDTLRETPEKLQAKHKAGEIDTEQYIVGLQDLTRRRDQAAQNAAPYIHPRLSSIEANVGLKGHDAFVELMAEMAGQ